MIPIKCSVFLSCNLRFVFLILQLVYYFLLSYDGQRERIFTIALYNYFIPYHYIYIDQHNQCDICAVHDGKVGCDIPSNIQKLYCILIGCIFCGTV